MGPQWPDVWWHVTELQLFGWYRPPSWTVIKNAEFNEWLHGLGFTGYCKYEGPEWEQVNFEEDVKECAERQASIVYASILPGPHDPFWETS
jgi:hypothetical protein